MGSCPSSIVGPYSDATDNRSPLSKKGQQRKAANDDGNNDEGACGLSGPTEHYNISSTEQTAAAQPKELNAATAITPCVVAAAAAGPSSRTTMAHSDERVKSDEDETEYSFHFYDNSAIQGQQENPSGSHTSRTCNSNMRRHRASLNTRTVQKQKDTGHAYYEAEQYDHNNNNTFCELNSVTAHELSNLECSGRASQTDMNSFMNTSQLDVNSW